MTVQKSLTISRVLKASAETVWQAWTDPEKIRKWWGPRDFTSIVQNWELHEGGKIDLVMIAGENLGDIKGQEFPMTGEFKEIDENNRKLVFSSMAVMDGKPVLETLCTLTLEKQGDNTKMNLNITVTKTTPEAEGPLSGMEIGWNQQIDKLTEFVE